MFAFFPFQSPNIAPLFSFTFLDYIFRACNVREVQMIQKGTMLLYFKHKKFLSFFNLKYVDYLSVFRKYDKKWMIEMDRFVYNLNGEVSEVIQRQSIHSAATMKERQSHLKRFIEY